MARILGVLLISSLTHVLACTAHQSVASSDRPDLVKLSSSSCSSDISIPDELKRLSSDDESRRQQSRQRLLEYSTRSPTCRSTIVRALIEAMDKPNLNFLVDHSSFLLWREGSLLLGELKAEEAIDLLIEHLDLNDGLFSASMSHQPAVGGLTKMGAIAIPKLSVALRSHHNRNIRLTAALCLFGISESSAVTALEDALDSESDECVRRFIRLSLEISGKRSVNNGQSSTESDVNTEINLRRQLLLAFRCNN